MDGKPVVILLVEDDPAHAEIVKRNFEMFQVANRLIHVADGQEALDYLHREGSYGDPEASPRPGLILLDLRLPKVDGLDVLRIVKDDQALQSIPIIILTTSDAESDIARAYSCKANSYLVKPVDFYKFADLLKTIGYYWLAWNQNPHLN